MSSVPKDGLAAIISIDFPNNCRSSVGCFSVLHPQGRSSSTLRCLSFFARYTEKKNNKNTPKCWYLKERKEVELTNYVRSQGKQITLDTLTQTEIVSKEAGLIKQCKDSWENPSSAVMENTCDRWEGAADSSVRKCLDWPKKLHHHGLLRCMKSGKRNFIIQTTHAKHFFSFILFFFFKVMTL